MNRLASGLMAFCLLTFSPSDVGFSQVSSPIEILIPAPGDSFSSSIPVSAHIEPDGDGLLRVVLYAGSGQVIARQLLKTPKTEQTPILFESDVFFEQRQESQPALLCLSISDRYHRPQALRSVYLTLEDQPADQRSLPLPVVSDWLQIDQPQSDDTIAGGQFLVTGVVRPITALPIYFDLITDTGGIIGTSQLAVADPGAEVVFSISLSYSFIDEVRDVRLVVRQSDPEFGARIVLDSIPLWLEP